MTLKRKVDQVASGSIETTPTSKSGAFDGGLCEVLSRANDRSSESVPRWEDGWEEQRFTQKYSHPDEDANPWSLDTYSLSKILKDVLEKERMTKEKPCVEPKAAAEVLDVRSPQPLLQQPEDEGHGHATTTPPALSLSVLIEQLLALLERNNDSEAEFDAVCTNLEKLERMATEGLAKLGYFDELLEQ